MVSQLCRLFTVVLLAVSALSLSAQETTTEDTPEDAPESTLTISGTIVPVLQLDGTIVEQRSPFALFGTREKTIRDIGEWIDSAAEDPEVGALIVRIVNPVMGLAQTSELHTHLQSFRQSGKPVIVLAEILDLKTGLLASAGDEIVMTPVGVYATYGISVHLYYFKDLLAKLGIQAQAIPIGEFKSALEPFTHSEMSDGTRIQMTAILEEISSYFVDAIASNRGMSAEEAEEALWSGPHTSQQALQAGLITRIAYFEQYQTNLEKEHGVQIKKDYKAKTRKSSEPLNLLSLFSSVTQTEEEKAAAGTDQVIALVYALGPIIDGKKDENPFASQQIIASEDFIRLIDEVEEEDGLAAVVLRVDSPGGSAIASDRIWQRINLLRDNGIPIVVSMGDIAASGGYYISMGADRIVAEPTTLTGSIGVIGGGLVLGGTYDKIGVNKQMISIGAHAGLADETRPWTEEERQVIEELLLSIYEDFTTKAAQGREMGKDELLELAQGRVWIGSDAEANGLVDDLGGTGKAIAIARELASAPNARIVTFPKELTFMEFIEKILAGEIFAPHPPLASLLSAIQSPYSKTAIPQRHLETVQTVIGLLESGPSPLLIHPMLMDIE